MRSLMFVAFVLFFGVAALQGAAAETVISLQESPAETAAIAPRGVGYTLPVIEASGIPFVACDCPVGSETGTLCRRIITVDQIHVLVFRADGAQPLLRVESTPNLENAAWY